MKFDLLYPGVQSNQYQNWHLVHSPTLSLDWLHALLDLDLASQQKDDDNILKLDEATMVLKLDSDLGHLVATLYKTSSFKQVITNTIHNNPAYNCWGFAHYLRNKGLGTPEPLAYIEEKKMGLSYRSWYVCRFDGGISCADYFLHAPSFTPAMVTTASTIVDMFINLRECQLSHGKIKANNLLISSGMLSLIDLHCMQHHRVTDKAEQLWRLDINHFMDNWWERFDIEKQFRLAFSKRGIDV